MDIVLIGRIAEAGTLEAIEANRDRLVTEYGTRYFNEGVEGLEAEFGDDKCMRLLNEKSRYVFVIGKQSIYRALWVLGETLDCGLRVRHADIPIKQFCIEIADRLDINPYLMDSLGCILACTDSGRELVTELEAGGYTAHVIGFTTGDNIKGIINHEELTYLTPDGI